MVTVQRIPAAAQAARAGQAEFRVMTSADRGNRGHGVLARFEGWRWTVDELRLLRSHTGPGAERPAVAGELSRSSRRASSRSSNARSTRQS
jgi:hypothetical protein